MTRIGVVFITNGALEWKTTRHRPVLRSIHFRTDGCEWIKASTRLYVERKRIGLLDLPLPSHSNRLVQTKIPLLKPSYVDSTQICWYLKYKNYFSRLLRPKNPEYDPFGVDLFFFLKSLLRLLRIAYRTC
jgi:hypothetical protein